MFAHGSGLPFKETHSECWRLHSEVELAFEGVLPSRIGTIYVVLLEGWTELKEDIVAERQERL
jgi:hypothetical protein